MKTPCIVCRCDLDNLDERGNQPSLGLEFTSQGHYGSTVFDPMDGTGLAVNICDDCLTSAQRDGHVLFVDPLVRTPPPRPQYSVWKQEDEPARPHITTGMSENGIG